MSDIDWKKIAKIYCIGIKGSGMAALAELLHRRGFEVSGSDVREKFFTEASLNRSGIFFREGFSPDNLPSDADLVIHSTAYSASNNMEMAEAEKGNFNLVSYPEALGSLFNDKMGIAVCGTHGKTTTSAMLATALKAAGTDPEAVIGSLVIGWPGGILAGKGNIFVVEADEYQNKLRHYRPFGAVLTSVDWDHPDYFPTFEEYKRVFEEFVERIPPHGFLVVWGDGRHTLEVADSARCKIIRYGFHEGNEAVIGKTGPGRFSVTYGGQDLGEFSIGIIGDHNILNAGSVVAVCRQLNLDMSKVRIGLAEFRGTARRMEARGDFRGALLFDDYAHHPEEIRATLKGLREAYPGKKINVVFHPHTFSRTKALLGEFSQSFDGADAVAVLDIYGSAREVSGGVTSVELVDLINRFTLGKAMHFATIEEARDYFSVRLGPGDLLITMGAGNVNELLDKIKT